MPYNSSNSNKESNTDLQQNPWTQTRPVGQPSSVAQSDTPTYTYPIKRISGLVQGTNSRVRDGQITLDKNGILIEGRAILPTVYQWLIIPGILTGIGWIPIALFLTYYRSPHREKVRWDDVAEIVLEPKKRRICFVCPTPDNPQKMCSLVMQCDESTFTSISQAARYYAGAKTHEGKIQRLEVIAVLSLLGIFLLIFLIAYIGLSRT
jgi:hypothetical protein